MDIAVTVHDGVKLFNEIVTRFRRQRVTGEVEGEVIERDGIVRQDRKSVIEQIGEIFIFLAGVVAVAKSTQSRQCQLALASRRRTPTDRLLTREVGEDAMGLFQKFRLTCTEVEAFVLIAMCGNLMACSPDVLNDSGPMLGIVAAAKECGRDTVPLEHVEIAIDTAADRVSAAAIDAERRQIASHLNGGPVDMDSNRDDCPSSVRPARHLLRVHALTSPLLPVKNDSRPGPPIPLRSPTNTLQTDVSSIDLSSARRTHACRVGKIQNRRGRE